MSQQEPKPDFDPVSEEELEKLHTRHDAVHHIHTTPTGGGLTSRGKGLEDEWIKREEKRKADEKRQREAKEKEKQEAADTTGQK